MQGRRQLLSGLVAEGAEGAVRRLGLERCSTVGMEGCGAWGDGECGTPGTMVEVSAASSSQAHCSQSEDGRESCTGCLLGAPSLALRLQPRCPRGWSVGLCFRSPSSGVATSGVDSARCQSS